MTEPSIVNAGRKQNFVADDRPMSARRSLRNRIARHPIAMSDDRAGRAVIGCTFSMMRLACRIGVLKSRAGPDLNIGPIVSDKFKFIFLGIPKVATKSVGHTLVRFASLDARLIGERPASALVKDDRYAGYRKFSFVRNPWSRVVSCYENKIREPRDIGRLAIIAKHSGLSPGMPFDAFVEWLCSDNGQDENADRHWVSQHRLLSDDNGSLTCDFVGRLENIATDFARICNAITVPATELLHRNRSRSDRQQSSYRNLYNEHTRKLVQRRYGRDIETFEYLF